MKVLDVVVKDVVVHELDSDNEIITSDVDYSD
jgi:hypothetical protein